MSRKCYIGVNLTNEQVTQVAIFPDLIRDAYTLEGEFGPDAPDGTTIYVNTDKTYNGNRALAIALAENQQGIGLGWNFKVQ